jgi:hypothetical protein
MIKLPPGLALPALIIVARFTIQSGGIVNRAGERLHQVANVRFDFNLVKVG